jgi:two-component system chemotaxis response regulator CheY
MMRVLVVEDSSSVRSFVRDALEVEAGFGDEIEVVGVSSGFDALRMLPRGHWNLVITDVNMPDINGLDVIRFMRGSDQHRATPILIISTQSSAKDRDRGMVLGANAFLAKPFAAAQLATVVRQLLVEGTANG